MDLIRKTASLLSEKAVGFATKVFVLFVAFGDAIVDYIASFVSIFDCIDFDDGDVYLPRITDPLTEFKREILNAHNNYRTAHSCPPLVLSEELSSNAQAWADKLADKGYLQYSENPSLGENICELNLDSGSFRKAGEQLVKEWYREIDHYNFNNPGWRKEIYRVSQMLWKSTTEMGVGLAKLPGQKKAIVVVNYRPAGNNNMPGEFERNVLPRVTTNNVRHNHVTRT